MRTGRGRWGLVGLRAVALAVAIAAAGVSTASANTVLHVDAVHGADTGNCQGSPCKTLTYAVLQGRLVADLITIQAAAGVYAEDLALGSADSGLTITGAGSGADPAANTVIIGTGPQPTIAATDPLSLSHLRILNPASDAQDAVRTTGAGAAVSLSDVAIDQQGTGAAVTAGGDIAIAGGSVTLESAGSSATAIVGAGSVALERSPIIVNGTGGAVQSGAAASLSNLSVTLEDAADPHTALALSGRGSTLSNVSITGAWSGPAISDKGSLQVIDSSITSGGAPVSGLLQLFDGAASGLGSDMSIVRSTIHQQSSSLPAVAASNANVAIDSSEILGGSSGIQFSGATGASRSLTIVSSTIDAGTLGSRDASPVQSLVALADNTAGSVALVNVEGSILVEPPAATRAGTNGTAAVNCSGTEVPGTTQTATPALGAINCGTGTSGNTSTTALSAIFANPGSGYVLNPSWNGIDSVPESAISLPAPFSDSATDLLGNPRVVNGIGTCQPGVRDKGAIELSGHVGVVPTPVITTPSSILPGVAATLTASAPNLPAGVPITFTWKSSDGGTGTGPRFTHTFTKSGSFRVSVTATGAVACVAGTSRSVPVHGVDLITGLTLSPGTFRAAPSGPSVVAAAPPRFGTAISYQGTESATTTFTVQFITHGRMRGKTCKLVGGQHPKGKRCTIYLSVGAFNHADTAGPVVFRFTGRLLGRRLPPANYRLRGVPKDPVGLGPTVFANFTIKR